MKSSSQSWRRTLLAHLRKIPLWTRAKASSVFLTATIRQNASESRRSWISLPRTKTAGILTASSATSTARTLTMVRTVLLARSAMSGNIVNATALSLSKLRMRTSTSSAHGASRRKPTRKNQKSHPSNLARTRRAAVRRRRRLRVDRVPNSPTARLDHHYQSISQDSLTECMPFLLRPLLTPRCLTLWLHYHTDINNDSQLSATSHHDPSSSRHLSKHGMATLYLHLKGLRHLGMPVRLRHTQRMATDRRSSNTSNSTRTCTSML